MALNSQIRVMLVDSLAASRKHLCQLILPLPDIEVVGIARTGGESIQLTKVLEPDIILLDPNFSDRDSLETIQTLMAVRPNAGIIVLSVMSDPDYLQRAYQAGVRGILPQPPPARKLADMIRDVHGR